MFANIHKVLGKFEYQDGGKVVERELVGRRLNSCLRYEQTIGWFRMKKTVLIFWGQNKFQLSEMFGRRLNSCLKYAR